MRRHVYIRPARAADSEEFLKWSRETPGNLFDPAAAKHPSSFTVCAYNSEKKILFAPVQKPFVMEALAINPEASELEVAAALKDVVKFLVSQAHLQGVGEIVFLCGDESTSKFAESQVFERLPYSFYRLRISDTEKSPENEQTKNNNI